MNNIQSLIKQSIYFLTEIPFTYCTFQILRHLELPSYPEHIYFSVQESLLYHVNRKHTQPDRKVVAWRKLAAIIIGGCMTTAITFTLISLPPDIYITFQKCTLPSTCTYQQTSKEKQETKREAQQHGIYCLFLKRRGKGDVNNLGKGSSQIYELYVNSYILHSSQTTQL